MRVVPWLALFVLAGCSAPGVSSGMDPGMASGTTVNFVGIDTSGSARQDEGRYLRAVRDLDESTPADGQIEIYRFDTKTFEVYVGHPLEVKPLKETVRKAVAEDRGQKGTSLLSLVQKIDSRLKRSPHRTATVLICTDCGVELMTTKEHQAVRDLTGGWAESGQVRSVRIVGVRPMHRDVLRADFEAFGERLDIG